MSTCTRNVLPNVLDHTQLSKIDVAAYIYLLLPLTLFISGWLEIWMSVPLISLLVYSAFRLYQTSVPDIFAKRCFTEYKEWMPALVVFISYVFLTGVTGNWAQHPDYYVRNDIFWDLTTKTWPPTLQDGKYFVYYFQSWLPASLVGSIFGWGTALWVHFFWSSIGILFAVYYIFKLTGRCSYWIACIFFIWNGLEYIPCSVAEFLCQGMEGMRFNSLIHFSEPPMFSIKALMHCFIPISIIGGMLMNPSIAKKLGPSLGILAVMYNPMGSMFLLPILLFIYFRIFFFEKKDFLIKEKWMCVFNHVFSFHNVSLIIPFVLLIYPYYSSSNSISSSQGSNLMTFSCFAQFVYYLFFNIIIASFLIRKNVKDKLLWVVLIAHILSATSGLVFNPDIAKKGSFITTYFFIIMYCQAFCREKSAFKIIYVLYSIIASLYFVQMTGAFASTIAGIIVWILFKIKPRNVIFSVALVSACSLSLFLYKPDIIEPIKSKLRGDRLKYNENMGIYQADGGSGLWWWYKAFPDADAMPIWFKR